MLLFEAAWHILTAAGEDTASVCSRRSTIVSYNDWTPISAISHAMVASTKPEPTKAQNGAADVKRDPIAEFAAVEAGRPPYDHSQHWEMSKTPNPEWKIGSGASIDCKDRKFLAIDPQEEGRSVVSNYKLMISSTVPRPIAMVSTVTADGQTKNLAPFSFYNCVTADVSRQPQR